MTRILIILFIFGTAMVGCGTAVPEGVTLQWLPFDTVQAAFPSAPKPLFLYVSQAGCDHCDYMDSSVFARPEIAHFINENFTAVRVDIYQDMPITVRDSLLFEFEFRQLLSIEGVPAYYFFDAEGRPLGVLDSEREPLAFKRMLIYVAERHFFRIPWDQFMALPQASEEAIDDRF